jgi:hypothetical protein
MILQPEIKIKQIRELKNVSQEFVANKIRTFNTCIVKNLPISLNKKNQY